MRINVKRLAAGILAAVLAVSSLLTVLSGGMCVYAEESGEDSWMVLQEKLKQYGGTWNTPEYEGAFSTTMPKTALQGNGDVGVISFGNENEKTYLIEKGDFRNGGDLVTSDPFGSDDRSIRQIALGGLTIKKDTERNASLTRQPGVTVEASSVHDNFTADLAVNGIISAKEEAWASKMGEEPHWFQVDLGSEKTIAKYILYHMGYAREDLPHFNAKEYIVSVSSDGEQYMQVDHVTNNTENVTFCLFDEPVHARYVKIDFIQGEQNSNDRARIAELELFEDASEESMFYEKPMENLSLTQEPGVTIQASTHHDDFVAEYAVNGTISKEEEGWVSTQGVNRQWLKIDLGETKTFQKYVMYHIGKARPELAHFNTKAYTVSVSEDDAVYREIDAVTDNSADCTQKVLEEPVSARYIKITFQEAEQNGAAAEQRVRVAEFELFASPEERSVFDSFTEHQDIVAADLTTEMNMDGVWLEMKNWLSATENTMVTEITSKGGKAASLDAEVWTKSDGSENFHSKSDVLQADNAVWASRSTYNAAKENPESWTSEALIYTKVLGADQIQVKKNKDASSSLKFVLAPGNTAYLVTTVGGGGQTYDYQDRLKQEAPLASAQALSGTYTAEADLAALRREHEQWWKDYWMRSYIDIGDEEFHRYYYGSLYYMGCAGREDKAPTGQYGPWVTGDNARYNNDYHLNYNYMAPYYGMYSSNRMEGAFALAQPILDYMPKAEYAAKHNLSDIKADYVSSRPELADGIDGAVIYPVGLTSWGQVSWEAERANKYISQTLNAPFAASIFISCYNYSQDETFLVEKAYPFVEKVAKFYESWCEKEEKPDGSYQYNLYDGAHEGFFDKNAGVTIGVVQNVYEFLISNFDILKEKAGATDMQLAKWKDMYEHMAPVPIRTYETGSFKKEIFALSEDGMILRPESASVELEFVHPGERLSFDADEYLLETGRNTVEAKDAANPEVWGNINNNPKIYTQAIRVGFDPSYIMEKFRKYNISNMNRNFTIIDGEHGIEKAGGIEFINNMLLQSDSGILKAFPNWTGDDAQFYQLREKGAYLVSSRIAGGTVAYIDVVSEAGRDVTLVSPWEYAQVVDSKGNPVEISYGYTKHTEEKTIAFAAKPGEMYCVTEGAEVEPEPEYPDDPGEGIQDDIEKAQEAQKRAEAAETAYKEAQKLAEAAKAEAEKAKAETERIQKEAKEAAEKAQKEAEAARKEVELARAEAKKAKEEAEAARKETLQASIEKVSLKTGKSSKAKQIKITWSKQKNIDGYELWYAADSKFKRPVKKIIGKNKTSYTIKKLKSRKRYYVKVRAYKKKNGGKIYGAFSRKLAIKAK